MTDTNGMTAAKPANIEMFGPPEALSAAPTPLSLLKALRLHWPLALLCATTLGITAAVLAWFLVPEGQYTARTKLRVPANSAFLVKDASPGLNIADHQKLQIAMVKSRLVLGEALKNPKVSGLPIFREMVEPPIEWLERELQADFGSAPEVLRIALVGKDRFQLVKLVDAIREAYCEKILDREAGDRLSRLSDLKKLREIWDNKLNLHREERKTLERIAGGPNQANRAMSMAFAYQQLMWLEKELLVAQAGIRRAQADLVAIEIGRKEGSSVTVPETMIEDRLAKEQSVQNLTAKISQKRSDMEAAQAVVLPGKEVARVQQLQREIDESEKALKELRPKLLPRITEEIQKQIQSNAELADHEVRFKLMTLEKEQEALIAQVAKARTDYNDQQAGAGKLDEIKDDMTHVEEYRKWLAREEEKLDLEIRAAPARYYLIEEGLATRPPEGTRRLMVTGGAGFGVFAAIMALFALVEFRARRVGGPDEMAYGLGLPVVATIPDNTSRGKRGRPLGDNKPQLSEAIDTFRTMLIKAGEAERMRVVMITSAQSGEGKTSLSTHLAASLAQVGYATLLVDGDLRNPLAHRVFELSPTPGLCDLLRGEATLEDLIRPTPIERLWMITAGEWDGAASRALAHEKTRQIVDQLRSRFDYIIIDSSPVLPVVDPLLLGTCADGAVISVLSKKSRMPLVYAAYQRLSSGGVRVLGTVVNGVQGEQYGSYYRCREMPVEA